MTMTDQIEQIRMEYIDDPQIAMRTMMDEEKLSELCGSIRLHGLISPLVVRKIGKRYEVIAGHRRLKALQLLQTKLVPCVVKEITEANADTLKMHENMFREDVNPVDEAMYIRKILDEKRMTMEELIAASGKRKEYLQARSDLMDYPEYMLEAIYNDSMSLGVAGWLVRIEDEHIRKEYTRFACSQGISAYTARDWWEKWKLGALPREAASYIPPDVQENAAPKTIEMACVICGHLEDINYLQMHYAHGECKHAAERAHQEARKHAARENTEAPQL